ncbi:unnamed protein product [Fraxinus pennsylvanica]|uniref:Vacuole membrane protein KMS1 n=1 Tax=Fraxinus pennsylvanica TaxID=56036 RepID=A0AAD2DSG5_9LAMI|nr:unnamed protein product [Fraxinus pennsylvanica]
MFPSVVKLFTFAGLHAKHQQELENLTLTIQPTKTLKLFTLAVMQYVRRSISYLLSHSGRLMLLSSIVILAGVLLVTIDGPREKHVDEVLHCIQFGFWWVALGAASSIGLEFGPPLSSHGTQIPLSSILRQVQLEAILWDLGTALGELPPYFISRAAKISGGKVNAIEEIDASPTKDNGFMRARLVQIKHWFLSHAQYLNFFTILVLASVPNPLFDLAGIMCGQFGIPFWEFFLATVIGKALIKSHIQTVFIISMCNNQLLDWIENELIRMLSFLPGFDSILPNLVAKLHIMKDKYLATKPHVPLNVEVTKWDFSISFIWNTVVWFMLIDFFFQIVNATAQRYLKKQQEDIAFLMNKSSKHSDDTDISSR